MGSYREELQRVRASYTAEKAAEERDGERLAYWCYRPLSFYVTPLFLRLGWTADGVCGLQLVLALALPAVAWPGGWPGAAAVVTLALAIQVLDCVDGNLARTTRRFSPVGQLLEGFCTQIFWTFYFLAAGVVGRGEGSWAAEHSVVIGLAMALLFVGQRSLEDNFDQACAERVRWTPPAVQASRFAWWPKVIEHTAAFGGLLALAAWGRPAWFMIGLAAYQGTVFLLWLPRFVRAVVVRSRRGRGSE